MLDFVIVGQGLAGTCLAWRLRRLGRRVLVLDSRSIASSSRIAAGLITPVTGQRLAKSWRLDEFWPVAVLFYRGIEAETGRRFFHPGPMIRLFTDASEQGRYRNREQTLLRGLVVPLSPPLNPDDFDAASGGFLMPTAARLDVQEFLDASRERFLADGSFREATLDPAQDVERIPDGVRIPPQDVTARGVIFCQGFAATGNPWFPQMPFNPVKGEILTMRIPDLSETRVIHRGIWLAPAANGLYRAGATYEREQIDAVPTTAGREEICRRLRELLRRPFEVVDHHAGVRPVIRESRPVLATHPLHGSRIAIFNGLGSKGSLIAPYFAEELAQHLVADRPLERSLGFPNQRGESV